MIRTRVLADADHESGSSLLPILLAIVLAILMWMAAEECRKHLAGVESQLELTARAAARSADATELRRLEASFKESQAERTRLTERLRTGESAQMIRARGVFDLRRVCEASGASACSVRLADDTLLTSQPSRRRADSGTEIKLTLDDLGVQKARAIITGTFQKDEIVTLSQRLNSDPTAHWRINGLSVRASAFEIDVERHMIGPATRPEAR